MSEREDLIELLCECVVRTADGWRVRHNPSAVRVEIESTVDSYLLLREAAKPDPVAFDMFMRYCREHAVNFSCCRTPKSERPCNRSDMSCGDDPDPSCERGSM